MVTWTTFLPLTRNGQLCTFIFWQQHGIHVYIFAKPFFNQSIYTICSPSCEGKNMNNHYTDLKSLFWVINPLFQLPLSNQITVVSFQPVQLAQASFLQKNQMLKNVFLISVTLRWHSGIENHEIWTSKNVRIFLKKNFIEEYQFRTTFFDNFKIERLLFLKWRLIFGGTVLSQH
jgi:hypothetical protein